MNLEGRRRDLRDDAAYEEVDWPADAVSAVVIGVAHHADEPELDWWDGKGTPGNRILVRINAELSRWLEDTYSVKTFKMPYLIEKGGIFLKDAAVMAGLGCIGKSKLVITPRYGPRIRFRALLVSRKAAATGPLDFDFCKDCKQPCRNACPVKAFQERVHSVDARCQSILPGIDGTYDRVTCNVKMKKDIEEAVTAIAYGNREHRELRMAIDEFEEGVAVTPTGDKNQSCCVKYCRRCELSCPVGRNSS